MTDDLPSVTDLLASIPRRNERVPHALAAQIVERASETLEPLCAFVRDPANWAADPDVRDDGCAPLHAMQLLAAIGDARAFAALSHVVCTQELDDWLFDVAPAVFGWLDPSTVDDMVAVASDRSLEPFARVSIAMGLCGIACAHPAVRADVAARLITMLTDESEEIEFVTCLVGDAVRLADPDLQRAIDRAYEEDRINDNIIGHADVEEVRRQWTPWSFASSLDEPMESLAIARTARQRGLELGGAMLELRGKRLVERTRPAPQLVLPTAQVATVRNTAPKVGRNDPCPCGSGKKYKRCCGR